MASSLDGTCDSAHGTCDSAHGGDNVGTALFKHPRYMHGAATSENGGGRVAAGSKLQQGGRGQLHSCRGLEGQAVCPSPVPTLVMGCMLASPADTGSWCESHLEGPPPRQAAPARTPQPPTPAPGVCTHCIPQRHRLCLCGCPVKKAMDGTKDLGGLNFAFWGGAGARQAADCGAFDCRQYQHTPSAGAHMACVWDCAPVSSPLPFPLSLFSPPSPARPAADRRA